MACFDVPGDIMLTPDRRSIMLATGPVRLRQRLRVEIQTLLGSYKYNVRFGIPWFDWLDKSKRVPIESELRKLFLSHPEVQEVTLLNLTRDRSTRMLFVNYVLRLKSVDEITDTIEIAQLAS